MVAALALVLTSPATIGQSPTSLTPSLATVEKLEFGEIGSTARLDSPDYADILNIFDACKAYSRGLSLIKSYHEPILTRGAQGISLYRRVSPSVVLVLAGNLKGEKFTDVAIGTGAIVGSEHYVLTNWHVISGYQVAVIFLKPATGTDPSEQNAYGAKVIAEDRVADLALLKIVKGPASLIPIKLGNIADVQVAEDIHIIGHPHELFWSYSTGVISQVREDYKWTYSDGSKHSANVLQMQTAINPGNSGGPVLDDSGNILGLVAMSDEGQNLDYAIAIDEIKAFLLRAASSKARGPMGSKNPPIQAQFSATTAAGLKIVKTIYPDLVVYSVDTAQGLPAEILARQTDGTTARGSGPNGFGGFADWEVTLASGERVVSTATGAFPETIRPGK